jgi:hypothetical protein
MRDSKGARPLNFRDPIRFVLGGCVAASAAYLLAWYFHADHVTAFYISLVIWAPCLLVAGILAAGEYLFSEAKASGKRLWDFEISDADNGRKPTGIEDKKE